MKMTYNIRIGKYRLGMLDSFSIHSSVELLSDTAKITLPGQSHGKTLNVEDRLKVGDEVLIEAGYNNTLKQEFKGYLSAIETDNGSLVLACEDAVYLTRKALPNKQLKNVSVKELLNEVVKVMGNGYTARTNYSRTWDKFVFQDTNGYDVLKKIQEECALNVYVSGKELIAEPIDTFNSNQRIILDFAENVETESLKYRKSGDRKYEVTVEGLNKNGERKKVQVGTPGGEKRHIIITSWENEDDLKQRGKEEMKRLDYDGYEGDITTWGVPYIRPGYAAEVRDQQYEYKNGVYFIPSVTTEFSRSGFSRKVQLGRKLSNG